MKINLALEKPLTRDSGKALTKAQLVALTDGNTASSGTGVGAGETLSVVCDLGARYDLSEIRYYRARASVDTISLFGKQNASDNWGTLSAVESSYTSASISGTSDKYRYVKLTHAVTTGSGTARELQIYTDDVSIQFGNAEQGRRTEYTIDTGTDSLTPLAVHLYNPDGISHDFFALMDPLDPDSSYYSLASGVSGPYVPLHGTGINLPGTFPWSSGSFVNTSIVSNTVRKSVGTSISGTYFSPVIDLNSLEGRRLFWTSTLSGTNELDVVIPVDTQPTVHVRMSNVAPASPWVSGQLAVDNRWSTTSGTLPFSTLPNYSILDAAYKRYFQARIEFHTTVSGQTPVLNSIGVETGFKVVVPAGSSSPIYVKSSSSENRSDIGTSLVSWYADDRDIL